MCGARLLYGHIGFCFRSFAASRFRYLLRWSRSRSVAAHVVAGMVAARDCASVEPVSHSRNLRARGREPRLAHDDPTCKLMLIRLFQQTTIGWGLGLKRQVRKVQRIPDAVVRGRSTCGSEAKESLEGGHGLLSAIVPKDELVEVGLELRAADPVMSADEPLLEVADGAIGEWHHRWRALAQFGSQRLSARDVLEAEFLQASKAFEAVGMNGRARSNVLRDEAVDRRRPEVRDDCHTGTPRSSSALLNGYHDECRAAPLELAASSEPGLGTANPGVVDFYLAVKRLARRIHRRSPQLVKYHPSGFVTLETELVLEKQRRDPSLIGRHQVGRPEPEGQRGLRIVKDCPRCQRDLVTTGGAMPESSSHKRVPAISRASGALVALGPAAASPPRRRAGRTRAPQRRRSRSRRDIAPACARSRAPRCS